MKLPERSTVRISPLSRSTWMAREAVTTETPYAPATSRALGTFVPFASDKLRLDGVRDIEIFR